jgi:CBS domain-containing protein
MKFDLPATVSELMTRDVVTVDENDTLLHLLASMKSLRFRHLPVTDGDRLIGLVTERDLLAIASSNLLPEQAERDRILQERYCVRDVMVRQVMTVSPETSLQQAGRLLLKQRFGCLPVVDANNVLCGILTASDYVAAIVRTAAERGASPRDSGGMH